MNEWGIFLNSDKLTIFQMFEGEIRFGPIYLSLKSNPKIQQLECKLYGDWFFRTKNGVFLQEWNSLQNANSNLIYINFETKEFLTLQRNIKSVFWDMVEEDEFFTLNIDGNFTEIRINKNKIQ